MELEFSEIGHGAGLDTARGIVWVSDLPAFPAATARGFMLSPVSFGA